MAQGERRPECSWDQGFGEGGGQVWKLGRGLRWGSSERGLQPELELEWELSGPGPEPRQMCCSPAPSLACLPLPAATTGAARSSPGPV